MPGPSLTPPGGLQHHIALVALTPALLVLGAAAGSAAVGGRGASVLAGIGLVVPLVLQALFLLPDGLAAQTGGPHLGGAVRIGWAASSAALLLGAWAGWRWRAAPRPWAWPTRVSLALLLPVLLLPPLVLAAEPDAPPAGRRWRIAAALALTPLAWWWPLAAMAAACAVAASAAGPWRPALLVAALASVSAAVAAPAP